MNSLRKGIEGYVTMKRAMGFIFGGQERNLLLFCRFMENERQPYVTRDLAMKWALGSAECPNWMHAKKLGIVRHFAIYWKTVESKTEVWPEKTWPMRYKRVSPYIYSDGEIQRLLKTCLTLEPKDSLRPLTFYTMFGLIAACGLRMSEALKLTQEDVDLKNGIVTIRRTKFNKTRAVPVHETTLKALQNYCLRREKLHPWCRLPQFFITEYEGPIRIGVVEWTFDKIALACGVRTQSRRGPRIHDLRHTFVVRTLEEWYRQGKDVDPLLPILSTYVGHVQPDSTYWYMTITPELMKFASDKLDRYMGGFGQ